MSILKTFRLALRIMESCNSWKIRTMPRNTCVLLLNACAFAMHLHIFQTHLEGLKRNITPMSRRTAPNCFPPSLTTAKVPPRRNFGEKWDVRNSLWPFAQWHWHVLKKQNLMNAWTLDLKTAALTIQMAWKIWISLFASFYTALANPIFAGRNRFQISPARGTCSHSPARAQAP